METTATTYTANKRNVKDAPMGDRSSWLGGSASLTVTDADGNIVALYTRQRGYRSVETVARYTRPDGQVVAFYTAGKYNTVRNRWIAEVFETFGVKF
jgi:hypothetical protein